MQLIPESAVRGWGATGHVRYPGAISSVCPHCGERGVFTLSSQSDDKPRRAVASSGRCPSCTELIHVWSVRGAEDPRGPDANPEAIYMYPAVPHHFTSKADLTDIPEPLLRAFLSTIDAFNSRNYSATAVCCRRTLEGIFKYLVDETKRGAPLGKLIEAATADVDLAEPLKTLSHAIRTGGNLGAHFDIEREPDEVIAREMVELLDYLISYLYVLPKAIRRLEESLAKEA